MMPTFDSVLYAGLTAVLGFVAVCLLVCVGIQRRHPSCRLIGKDTVPPEERRQWTQPRARVIAATYPPQQVVKRDVQVDVYPYGIDAPELVDRVVLVAPKRQAR